MNAILIGICLYVAIQFAIGLWVARRNKRESDYILAGRNVGTVLAAFSVFATWFGAETVLGSAGRVHAEGLSGAQGEPFAYGFAIILMGLFLAAPLRRRGFTTFADLFRSRFSRGVERLTVLLLVPGSVLWAAAQIRGFGQVFSATAGIDVTTGITVAFIAVVLYTMIGGLLADIYTDLVQGLAIIAGLVAIFIVVVAETGAPLDVLGTVDPKRFSAIGENQSLLAFIEQWAIPICGSLVALELISRLLACRTPDVARRASYFGGGAYLLVALIPVYLGLIGSQLLPDLEHSEQLIPQLAATYLPVILYIMFAGALISAILSTVDSALLACSAMISHNVIQTLYPVHDEHLKVWLARGGVAVLGSVAFVFALRADGIADLVELASACGTAGVFIATMFGLFTPWGGPASATAAMLTGAVVWLLGGPLFLELPAPYSAAVVTAAIVYIAAAVIEHRTGRTAS